MSSGIIIVVTKCHTQQEDSPSHTQWRKLCKKHKNYPVHNNNNKQRLENVYLALVQSSRMGMVMFGLGERHCTRYDCDHMDMGTGSESAVGGRASSQTHHAAACS